jgi:hypothetical protein
MSASDYLELALLNHLFNKTAYTAPTTFYVALCTTAPTDASTGSTIVEATYTGYARKSTVAADWTTAASGANSNANAITFAACTAGTSTVTHFAIVDASSAGNVLLWGALSASLAVSNGITPSFAVGALSNTCD